MPLIDYSLYTCIDDPVLHARDCHRSFIGALKPRNLGKAIEIFYTCKSTHDRFRQL